MAVLDAFLSVRGFVLALYRVVWLICGVFSVDCNRGSPAQHSDSY